MTHKLLPNSSRTLAAKAFAGELRRAMTVRKVSTQRLAEAAQVNKSAVNSWRAGSNFPRVETAARVAETLSWPGLLEIVRAARTATCKRPNCRRSFMQNAGPNQLYCTPACYQIHQQERMPTPGQGLAADLRHTLAFRAGMRGGIPKYDVERALATYDQSTRVGRKRVELVNRELRGTRELIEAMCRACEPDGICRNTDCPLRPASPFPLAASTHEAGQIRPAQGSWSPEFREKTTAAIRAANERRWTPEARAEYAEKGRQRAAARTPEERAAYAAAVSAGRRSASPG